MEEKLFLLISFTSSTTGAAGAVLGSMSVLDHFLIRKETESLLVTVLLGECLEYLLHSGS